MIVALIRCQEQILKAWYGCSVPDNATVSDVYYEYSSGMLDRFVALPDPHHCVEPYIGRSPTDLTRVSSTLKIEEAVSVLGMYVEFCVSSASSMMSSSETLEGEAMNAFSVLVQASEQKFYVPTKYTFKQPNAKLKLKNDT